MSGHFSYTNVIYYCFDGMYGGTHGIRTKQKISIDIEGVFK